MTYTVHVDSNSSYMDETERYTLGEFESSDEAIAACKKIVNEFLLTSYRPGMTAGEMFSQYMTFGEDPFIVSTDQECAFSARDYAKQRCEGICAG
jgi:hypothetical protein